jgi:hypothetical protein
VARFQVVRSEQIRSPVFLDEFLYGAPYHAGEHQIVEPALRGAFIDEQFDVPCGAQWYDASAISPRLEVVFQPVRQDMMLLGSLLDDEGLHGSPKERMVARRTGTNQINEEVAASHVCSKSLALVERFRAVDSPEIKNVARSL